MSTSTSIFFRTDIILKIFSHNYLSLNKTKQNIYIVSSWNIQPSAKYTVVIFSWRCQFKFRLNDFSSSVTTKQYHFICITIWDTTMKWGKKKLKLRCALWWSNEWISFFLIVLLWPVIIHKPIVIFCEECQVIHVCGWKI